MRCVQSFYIIDCELKQNQARLHTTHHWASVWSSTANAVPVQSAAALLL